MTVPLEFMGGTKGLLETAKAARATPLETTLRESRLRHAAVIAIQSVRATVLIITHRLSKPHVTRYWISSISNGIST